MTDTIPVTCGATEPNRRAPGYRRPHYGQHECTREPHTDLWHRCWCDYAWGVVEGE